MRKDDLLQLWSNFFVLLHKPFRGERGKKGGKNDNSLSLCLPPPFRNLALSFLTATSWRIKNSRSSSCVLNCALSRAFSRPMDWLTRSRRSAISFAQSTSASSCLLFSIQALAPSSVLFFSFSSSVCTSKRRARNARNKSLSCSCNILPVRSWTRSTLLKIWGVEMERSSARASYWK